MNKEILILAPFPNHRYKLDGMISRIKHIDNIFKDSERIYLYVSFFKNIKKYHSVEKEVEIYELNLLLHFILICKIIFNVPRLYIHSIYQIRHIWFLIPFYKGEKFLDVHGVVPEEIKYFGGSFLSFKFMSFVERIIFSTKRLTVICVTKKMISHFQSKYEIFTGSYILFNIFPNHIGDLKCIERDNLDLKDKETTFIYSGSCANWQKIELMLDLIESKIHLKYKFIILTSEIDKFILNLERKRIPLDRVVLKMVKPEELAEYYKLADYGFLLRDDNIVNSVANPTKLIEYLATGITPIVLNPDIGDYLKYQYEYLTIDQFQKSDYLYSNKSQINYLVANKMLSENVKVDLKKQIFNKA